MMDLNKQQMMLQKAVFLSFLWISHQVQNQAQMQYAVLCKGLLRAWLKVAADALAAWAVMKLVGFATGMAGGNPAGELNLGVVGSNHTGGLAGS